MQGQLLGAKQRKPICFRRQANTNIPARSCVLCVCFNTERNAMYYFNTERNAVYCVLYVFLFIFYNAVFFIVEPWVRRLLATRRAGESRQPPILTRKFYWADSF